VRTTRRAPGLPAKTIAAHQTAIVSGSNDRAVRTSKEAVYYEEATTPAAIGTPGSPNVVAAPVRSVFQTDAIAVRVRATLA
jgi:hypothetical protein